MSHPRFRELVLLAGVGSFFFLGYLQIGEQALLAFVAWVAVFLVMHLAVRQLAPRADAILVPVASALVAVGLVQLVSIDVSMLGRTNAWRPLGQAQAGWLAASAGAFVATLYVFRRGLGPAWRMRYTLALLGLAALLSPMLPWIGHEIRGARLWLQLGPMSFQPGEVAKVLLVLFVAAYLAERRELLSMRIRRIGPISVPDPRYLVPLGGMIALAMLIFVRQNDLGQPLLFFVTFLAIIWIATGRPVYPVVGLGAFAAAVWAALQFFPHVRPRFDAWLDPFATPRTTGYQIVQGWFAMAEGAIGGVGLVGDHTQPELIPFAWTDLILAAIGHTMGLAGVLAVVACYILLLTRIFFIALRSRSELHALAAAGFGVVIGIQTAVIAGGVTRLLPLTGVTLPFVSYGGSSLLTNFVILGCLVAVSNTESTTALRAGQLTEEPEEPEEVRV